MGYPRTLGLMEWIRSVSYSVMQEFLRVIGQQENGRLEGRCLMELNATMDPKQGLVLSHPGLRHPSLRCSLKDIEYGAVRNSLCPKVN